MTVSPFNSKIKYLIFSTKNGRLKYGMQQMFLMLINVFGMVLLLYGSVLLLSFVLYGIPHDFKISIQSVPECRTFTENGSIGRVLIQIFLLKFMALLGLTLFSAIIIQFLESLKLSILIVSGSVLLQYVLSDAGIVSFSWNML